MAERASFKRVAEAIAASGGSRADAQKTVAEFTAALRRAAEGLPRGAGEVRGTVSTPRGDFVIIVRSDKTAVVVEVKTKTPRAAAAPRKHAEKLRVRAGKATVRRVAHKSKARATAEIDAKKDKKKQKKQDREAPVAPRPGRTNSPGPSAQRRDEK